MAFMRSINGTTASYVLPSQHLGSDNFFDSIPRRSADVESTRNGVTISLRPWKSVRTWRAVYNVIGKTDLESLRSFQAERVFYLHPTPLPSFYYKVKWVESSFAPDYNSPDSYRLTFTLEEVL